MQRDSQATFAEAYYRHETVLLKTLVKILGDVESASDVSQSAFLRLWRYSAKHTINYPKALIFKTARNLALSELRQRSRQRKRSIFSDDPIELGPFRELPSEDKSQEEVISLREEYALILRAIAKLPDKPRSAFSMHRFGEMNYKQIASRLGVSESSVEKYISYALTELKSSRLKIRETFAPENLAE